MPIIEIKSMPLDGELHTSRVLEELCVTLAEQCNLELAQIRATWEMLHPGRYVHAGQAAEGQPSATHPVMVRLSCFALTDKKRIAQLMRCIGEQLEKALHLPDNVFVTYQNIEKGHVYDQGEIK